MKLTIDCIIRRGYNTMITYIKEFMERYQYPSEAREELLNGYQKLEDSKHFQAFQQLVTAYEQDTVTDYKEIFQSLRQIAKAEEIHSYTLNLLYLIVISKHLAMKYQEPNWTKEMFDGAMLDLKYKLLECHNLYNVWGNFVIEWDIGFFQLKLVALGRLQFELWEFSNEYEKDGNQLHKGDKVINLHIPSSGTLRLSDCEASFAMATKFFRSHFTNGPIPFVCESWLLYPANKVILPSDSNIVQFMNLFDIYEAYDDEKKQDLWRVYSSAWDKEPDQLPRNTTLQRAYADWMKQGNPVGVGKGVFFKD